MTRARTNRHWQAEAMRRIEADFNRSADTHLLRVELPALRDVALYLKDESTHVTGSLKHRLARSLFVYAIANGFIEAGTTVVEASSGSTAISEAYFARLVGLPFIAVMPRSTSVEKVALIESFGGQCHLVDDPASVYRVAAELARDRRGHYMDQFTYAERATDWRGNNNIAESIFQQMAREEHPVPRWIVMGAGTGGTSATIGRYVRHRGFDTELCVVDPEHSVFFDHYRTGDAALAVGRASGVEGIGRPRVEPSFVTTVVDRMIKVPDAASYAAMRFVHKLSGRRCGPSTGTNVWGAFQLLAEMVTACERGSVVTLLCDSGERYVHTCYDEAWLASQRCDLSACTQQLERFYSTGAWAPSPGCSRPPRALR
jgi:cysteine synthase A